MLVGIQGIRYTYSLPLNARNQSVGPQSIGHITQKRSGISSLLPPLHGGTLPSILRTSMDVRPKDRAIIEC